MTQTLHAYYGLPNSTTLASKHDDYLPTEYVEIILCSVQLLQDSDSAAADHTTVVLSNSKSSTSEIMRRCSIMGTRRKDHRSRTYFARRDHDITGQRERNSRI